MRDGFTFGQYSTWDFDMHVEKFPVQISPRRRRETYTIPGMNGNLHSTEDTFENYTQSYECYFHGEALTPAQAHAIKGWLSVSGEYLRLEDVYDPDHFRKATFAGPLNVINILNRYGRCTVKFDCAPQSFLKSGEVATVFRSSGTINNPTMFPSKPLMKVTGSGSGSISINGTTITINSLSKTIIFDCESQNAYSEPAVNQNGNISAPKFPVLVPGNNSVILSGGVASIEIIPRWWEL